MRRMAHRCRTFRKPFAHDHGEDSDPRKLTKRCDEASSSLEGDEYSDGSNAALPSCVQGSVARRIGTTQRSSSKGDLLMSGGTIVRRMES